VRNLQQRLILVFGLVLIVAASVAYSQPWLRIPDAETMAWRMTLVGANGEQRVLSFSDVRSMPAIKAAGGFFSSVGIVFGPYSVKGVALTALCDLVGGMDAGDAVMISAGDGYSTVLSYEQANGDFLAYTADLKELPQRDLQTLLIYEVDGKLLSHEIGKPMRLAIIGINESVLTEGSYWVKWVDRIEVLRTP